MHSLRIALGAVLLTLLSPAWSLQLITEQEAKAPPLEMKLRGITRGPAITQVSPLPDPKIVTASPFRLKVDFAARGGAHIDPDSVEVSYMRSPSVNLLERVKPGLSARGIELNDVKAPPGDHDLMVRVVDSEGRETVTVLKLRVGP